MRLPHYTTDLMLYSILSATAHAIRCFLSLELEIRLNRDCLRIWPYSRLFFSDMQGLTSHVISLSCAQVTSRGERCARVSLVLYYTTLVPMNLCVFFTCSRYIVKNMFSFSFLLRITLILPGCRLGQGLGGFDKEMSVSVVRHDSQFLGSFWRD